MDHTQMGRVWSDCLGSVGRADVSGCLFKSMSSYSRNMGNDVVEVGSVDTRSHNDVPSSL